MVEVDGSRGFRVAFNPRTGIFANIELIRQAALGASSLGEILTRLNLRQSGARYAQLRAALVKHGIEMPMKEHSIGGRFADRAVVAQAVRRSETQKQVLELLGLSLAGKNYAGLEVACTVFDLPLPPKRGAGSRLDNAQRDGLGIRRRKWLLLEDEQRVRSAVTEASSWSVAAQRLWATADSKDRAALRVHCAELGIVLDQRKAHGILSDRAAVALAVEGAGSITEALTRLNLSGSAYRRFVRACEEYGLNVPRASKSEVALRKNELDRSEYRWGRPEDVLRHDPAITQRRVRSMVLRYGLIPYICAVCGSRPIWRGVPLTLILDHVNGDPSDHR